MMCNLFPCYLLGPLFPAGGHCALFTNAVHYCECFSWIVSGSKMQVENNLAFLIGKNEIN